MPIAPVITKDIRQPACRTSQATMGADAAGPAKVPALKIAVASPRSPAGNHCLTILPEVGRDADSPTPSASRLASMLAKPVAAPVNMEANDQIVTDTALT